MKQLILPIVLAVMLAGAAQAHTPYLLPSDFTPAGDATIEGAYATQFFTPAVALGSPDFHAVAPDGGRVTFSSMAVQNPRTTLELSTSTRGTYRLTTGEVLGPVTQLVGVDGGWRPLAPGETPPEGAILTTLQTVTLAETYVTHGRPTDTPQADAGRLVIHPLTHPNRIAQAEGFRVRLTVDGQPFANARLVLYAANDPETDIDRAFMTDASGEATISFDAPGNYVLAARHRANAPAGAPAAVNSFTTSLTFEVYATLPELPPEEPQQPERRRRRSLHEY